jgi:serine/threonine protein kinase
MYVLFQCVAEAVAEKGLRGIAELVPFGATMFDIAKLTWEKYSERCQEGKQRDEIQQLAIASFEEAKIAAIEAAKNVAANQPELKATVELYLQQIPGSIRQSLKRTDDPTGTTVPATFVLRGAVDLAKLLPPSLPRFRPGDTVPNKAGWILTRQLGSGGFGEVWLARKAGYDSLVGAVKFCRNLDTRDRDLLHESKVIDQLLKHGPHPNIVKLMDVHLEGDAPWLMYEFVDGGDLTDLIRQWANLSPSDRQEKAIGALQELAAAIGYFHRLNPAIIHRDLKPANILCDKSGRLRITDFGISGIAAKHMIDNETRGVTCSVGRLQSCLYGSFTPLYASPQQKDGAAPDPRDDVHALGVIGYQMLTGLMNQAIGSDFAQNLKDAGVQKEVILLLSRCMAAKAERRPATGFVVAEEIGRIIAKKSIEKTAAPSEFILNQVVPTATQSKSAAKAPTVGPAPKPIQPKPPKPSAPKAEVEEAEIVTDRLQSPAKRKQRRNDDYDGDDDKPRSKTRRDDDDDGRSKKKDKGDEAPKKSNPLLIFSIIVGILFLCCCCPTVGMVLSPDFQKSFWEEFNKAQQKNKQR